MNKNLFGSTALALPLLALTPLANAAPTYYFNDPTTSRAAFDSAAGTVALESFETPFAAASSLTFPVGGPTAFTVSTTAGALSQSNFARVVSDGSFALAFEESPSLTVTFTFASPITAFGLDVNDMNFGTMSFSDNLGNTSVDVLAGDGGGPAGGPSFQNLQFFGVVNAQPFTTVQLTFTNTSLASGTLAVDRLEFGSASTTVPVPAGVWLLGLGLGLLGWSQRRR